MPKITVHGGPSIAGEPPAESQHAAPVVADEAVPEPFAPNEGDVDVSVSVDGVDLGAGEADETLGGDFKPLSDAVEGDTSEQVSEPDYETWTVVRLREVLAQRELSTAGFKAELIERLHNADVEASDG